MYVHYQNIANLIVCSGVALNLGWHYVNQTHLNTMIPVIFSHFCLET